MTKQEYPVDSQVQWVEKIRNLHSDYSNKILTVVSYNAKSKLYALNDGSGGLSFSDSTSIEAYNPPPELHLLDRVTETIMRHSYPMIRYVGPTGYEVLAECRCGVEIRDNVPDLFAHSTHISEEILKTVEKQ